MNRHFLSDLEWSARKKTRKICMWLLVITLIYLQLSISIPKFRRLDILKCTHWSDAACAILQWKGELLSDEPIKDKIEATVVISVCGGDVSAFANYLDGQSDNIMIRDMAIISGLGCSDEEPYPRNLAYAKKLQSQYQQPEIIFINWLIEYLEFVKLKKKITEEYYDNNDNHVIIFLNSNTIGAIDSRRSLDQVVRSAMENRFGCIQKPIEQMSYYHDPNVLQLFHSMEPLQPNQKRYYSNLGEWVDNLNASWILDGLVPVCYGSSFAVKSKGLVSQMPDGKIYNVLKAMQTDYKEHEYRELTEFMERSLAALFSRPLSEERIKLLKKYSTQVDSATTYTGSLVHSWRNHNWFGIFTGDTLGEEDIDLSRIRLTLVISYCSEDMSWMEEYFKDLNIQNVAIISKCSNDTDTEINGYSPPGAQIEHLPNVGRCDHSYASWMANMTKEDAAGNHIVLFMKASRFLYQGGMAYRPIKDVIRIANEHGFGCESVAVDKSAFYRTERIHRFNWSVHRGVNVKSPYIVMAYWLQDMGIELPGPLTPICFGGNFAAKATQIFPRKAIWNKMVTSLSRGDNIEEGHFAERAWAGILSYPLNSDETAVFSSIPIAIGRPGGPYAGALHLKE